MAQSDRQARGGAGDGSLRKPSGAAGAQPHNTHPGIGANAHVEIRQAIHVGIIMPGETL